MSMLDEIAKEKQRVGEALARVEAQCAKLAGQLSELEAAERVLARYSKGALAGKTASAGRPTPATNGVAAPARGRRRAATTRATGGKRSSSNLNERVLALATGRTQQDIIAACKNARPNHIGAAIARHKRAGRIEERDGRLYATQSTGTDERAAV
jgi:hypothetical protein